MEQVNVIGIDLAKNSFQLHGAREDGSFAFRKKLGRGKLLAFLAAQPRLPRWRWRRAAARTIGAARAAVSAMRRLALRSAPRHGSSGKGTTRRTQRRSARRRRGRPCALWL